VFASMGTFLHNDIMQVKQGKGGYFPYFQPPSMTEETQTPFAIDNMPARSCVKWRDCTRRGVGAACGRNPGRSLGRSLKREREPYMGSGS